MHSFASSWLLMVASLVMVIAGDSDYIATHRDQNKLGFLQPWAWDVEDYDCHYVENALVPWPAVRQELQDVVTDVQVAQWRVSEGFRLSLEVVIANYGQAMAECPFGAITLSIFVSTIEADRHASVATGTQWVGVVTDAMGSLFGGYGAHVVAATEWPIWNVLCTGASRIAPEKTMSGECKAASVSGYSAQEIHILFDNFRTYADFGMGAIKFLRALDPVVFAIMKDPSDYSNNFIPQCPEGGLVISITSSILSLMANVVLFEKFMTVTGRLAASAPHYLANSGGFWSTFCFLKALNSFTTRGFDLKWSAQQLFLPLPAKEDRFDRMSCKGRNARLREFSVSHPDQHTRDLATALLQYWDATNQLFCEQRIVYVSAVGGPPFANFIPDFFDRARQIKLPFLVLICLEDASYDACLRHGPLVGSEFCLKSIEGHVIYNKYQYLPTILSAGFHVAWVDFDIYLFQDPTAFLLQQAGSSVPISSQGRGQRARFGSFIFESSEELCKTAGMCHRKDSMAIGQGQPEILPRGVGVDMLVTEHFNAKCINNGFFFIKSNARTLRWMVQFLHLLYTNVYSDNQNLFDAFLSHTLLDAFLPDLPDIRYSLLSVTDRIVSAEGWNGNADAIVGFHFWASNYKLDEETRQERVFVGKDALFKIFFRGTDFDRKSYLEAIRFPRPTNLTVCGVTSVGMDSLMEEWSDEVTAKPAQPTTFLSGEDAKVARQQMLNELLRDKSISHEDVGLPAGGEASHPAMAKKNSSHSVLQLDAILGGPTRTNVGSSKSRLHEFGAWVAVMESVNNLQKLGALSQESSEVLRRLVRSMDSGVLITHAAIPDNSPDELAHQMEVLAQEHLHHCGCASTQP